MQPAAEARQFWPRLRRALPASRSPSYCHPSALLGNAPRPLQYLSTSSPSRSPPLPRPSRCAPFSSLGPHQCCRRSNGLLVANGQHIPIRLRHDHNASKTPKRLLERLRQVRNTPTHAQCQRTAVGGTETSAEFTVSPASWSIQWVSWAGVVEDSVVTSAD
jgi:hypothetical protein